MRTVAVFYPLYGAELDLPLEDVELGYRASNALAQEALWPNHYITVRATDAILLRSTK